MMSKLTLFALKQLQHTFAECRIFLAGRMPHSKASSSYGRCRSCCLNPNVRFSLARNDPSAMWMAAATLIAYPMGFAERSGRYIYIRVTVHRMDGVVTVEGLFSFALVRGPCLWAFIPALLCVIDRPMRIRNAISELRSRE